MLAITPNQEEVIKFAKLYKEKFGIELTPKEALDTCTRFVQIIYLDQLAEEDPSVVSEKIVHLKSNRIEPKKGRSYKGDGQSGINHDGNFLVWYNSLSGVERGNLYDN